MRSARLKLALVCAAILAMLALGAGTAQAQTCPSMLVNGGPDNQRDDLDYYYIITGGKFPTGPIPNGDNASGGVFRFLLDDPGWGNPIDAWQQDDWFTQNAGFALTMLRNGTSIYDNNGIEDGTYGNYYNGPATVPPNYGIYRGYSMSNNWDWIYASYFKIEQPTTIDTIIGYFDGDGYYGGFDPRSPYIRYRMNIWSSVSLGGNRYLPFDTASFSGDVFATDCASGGFSVSPTGVDRIKPGLLPTDPPIHDPIWRLTYKLATPVTLQPGVYFFSHDASITAAPSAAKQNVLGDLTLLRATVTDKEDGKKLDQAIDHLTKSLKADLWQDELRLQVKHGEKVFQEEQNAVNKLRQLVKDKKSAISDGVLLDLINRLVVADRALALVAISDAQTAGADAKKTAKANEELARGDGEAANGKPDNAIEHYRNAWKHAQEAMKKL